MQITIFKLTITLDGTANISPFFYKKPLCVLIILQLLGFGGCATVNNGSNFPVYLSDKEMGGYVINSNKNLISESFNMLSSQSNTHKVALIISNTYKGGILKPLNSSKKDAQEMEAALKSKGFEILGGSAHMDLSKKSIMELLDRLRKSIANEDNPRVVFYFSGHGYNNNGEDYLVSNSVASKDDIIKEVISLHEVYEHLPNTGLNIIFIDACRDLIIPNYNYFGSSEKANIPPNTFIDYGTSFASVSAAGKSSSEASKYTSLLAKAITESKPSESLESIHYKVANELNEKTNFSQRSVFNKGANVTAAEETLSGYSALFFNETEKGSKSDAIKLLFDECFNKALNGTSNVDTNDIGECAKNLAKRNPKIFSKIKFDDNDLMGSIVAQASEENNATALLMVGMYDITKKSINTGKMFDPSNPITGFQSKEKQKQRLAGWHAIIKSGELGNPVAALIGGSALLFGDLDPDMKDHYPQPDKALGIKLLDSAHNKGVGKASQYLAIAYHVGLSGVEKNQSKAKEYVLGMIKNTLYSENDKLNYLLPMLYALECAFGKNIPKDFACAFELSKWVAEFGKGKYMINGRSYAGLAAALIVQMHEPATGMDLIVKTKENEAISRHYLEISVSEDDALGEQYQALFYEAGVQGFPMDKKRAVYWYEKALNHKYLDEDQNSRYLLVNSLNRARSN